jgi:hydrogenase nickel incorporation protein HypB
MSVTEGEDKPLKYPTIYNTADVAIITKTDLAAAVEFNSAAAHANIQAVRPGMEILDVSVKTGDGMAKWMQLLESRMVESRAEKIDNADIQITGVPS